MSWLRLATVVAVSVLAVARTATADERHTVTGMVIETDPARLTFTASIDAIPHVMPAMTMPFVVRDAAQLAGVHAGAMVTFTLVIDRDTSYVEGLRVERYLNLEQDPARARRLSLFHEIARGISARMIEPGEAVPDFTLTDTRRQSVTLSDFRGAVVAINFTYTTCQLPDYCLRIVNHFGALQRRFADRLGRDIVFLTITFDPERDTPEVLAEYADQWRPNFDVWRFLSGPAARLRPVLDMFGVAAFPAEGLIDHALHTVVIGRDGRLLVNIEGNTFTTAQLGDLITRAIE